MLSGILLVNGKKYTNGKKIEYICKTDSKEDSNEVLKLCYTPKIEFNKFVVNRYVYYSLNPPKIEGIIGNVNDYDAYCEYELSKLHAPNSINSTSYTSKEDKNFKKVTKSMLNNVHQSNRTKKSDEFIFTIDNEDTKDFDDAISFSNGVLKVYISNVPKILQKYNLFEYLKRISTIYLPDRTISMLPLDLMNLCSLKEGETKSVLIFNYDIETSLYRFTVDEITVDKNFIYDTEELLTNGNYISIYNELNILLAKNKNERQITNSHELVEYCMLLMNYFASTVLDTNEAIFRTTDENYSGDSKEILNWYSNSAKYCLTKKEHKILNVSSYLHITSPIRRIVDVINMTSLLNKLKLDFLDDNFLFAQLKAENVSQIDINSKKIRKLQTRIKMIHLALNSDITKKLHIGTVFNEKVKEGIFSYKAYLHELKLVYPFKTIVKVDNFSENKFKIFLFNDEGDPKHKIKLELVNEVGTS